MDRGHDAITKGDNFNLKVELDHRDSVPVHMIMTRPGQPGVTHSIDNKESSHWTRRGCGSKFGNVKTISVAVVDGAHLQVLTPEDGVKVVMFDGLWCKLCEMIIQRQLQVGLLQ